MDFKKLEEKYRSDAAFNKVVNLHIQLLESFGFLPSEIREAAFLAQYKYETQNAREIIRTQDDWNKQEAARMVLQQSVLKIEDICKTQPY